jgi:hypothetical protein
LDIIPPFVAAGVELTVTDLLKLHVDLNVFDSVRAKHASDGFIDWYPRLTSQAPNVSVATG